jgi:hypothetical protein
LNPPLYSVHAVWVKRPPKSDPAKRRPPIARRFCFAEPVKKQPSWLSDTTLVVAVYSCSCSPLTLVTTHIFTQLTYTCSLTEPAVPLVLGKAGTRDAKRNYFQRFPGTNVPFPGAKTFPGTRAMFLGSIAPFLGIAKRFPGAFWFLRTNWPFCSTVEQCSHWIEAGFDLIGFGLK